MIYMTSDLHFNHQREFIYEPRGFRSVEEMNETIIENYNRIVKPEDEVYVLGDLCLGGADSLEENKKLIESLNGKIYIIQGNHDTLKRVEMYAACRNIMSVKAADYLRYGKYHLYLSHFPALTSNWDNDKPLKQRTINLCGHTHAKDRWHDWDKGPIYHVEVDAHNNTPVSIEQILTEMKAKI